MPSKLRSTDIDILKNILDEIKKVKSKLEELGCENNKKIEDDTIEACLVDVTESIEINITNFEKNLAELSTKNTTIIEIDGLIPILEKNKKELDNVFLHLPKTDKYLPVKRMISDCSDRIYHLL